MQQKQNEQRRPTTKKNASGCARISLLIFLFTFGPAIIIIGYLTGNTPISAAILTLITYIIAVLSTSVFERTFEKGFEHFDTLLKEMLDLLRWLLKRLLHPMVAYAILAITLTMVLITPYITPEIKATACVQTFLRPLCGNGIGITQISIDSDGNISTAGSSMNIGIIDENSNASFNQYDPFNTTEQDLEKLIFTENQTAKTGQYFTIILATTLSWKSPTLVFLLL